jgi:hypothetical protein
MEKVYIILHGGNYDGYNIFPYFFTNLEAAEKKAVFLVQEYNDNARGNKLKKEKSKYLFYSNLSDFVCVMELENGSKVEL